MQQLEDILNSIVAFMWGMPLVILLVGGGTFFVLHSRFVVYRYLTLAMKIAFGKQDKTPHAKSDLGHFQALMLALSGTLGLGNISGVAVAITLGGAGAIFWMWVTALVGITTKFYTATLAVKYRGLNRVGEMQGGPMYVIREGLGKRWLPLAWMFCLGCMMGTLPIYQINQLVQVLREFVAVPAGLANFDEHFYFDLGAGVLLCALIGWGVLGKLSRLSAITSRVVPFMVLLYFAMTLVLLMMNISAIPQVFSSIFTEAFSPDSVLGGTVGTIILIGVQRGAFSNEAGIGTESMAHGTSDTKEPVKEGLVAAIGPVIDTLIICTCTAVAILATGVLSSGLTGVSLTAQAFEVSFPGVGGLLVVLIVFFLSTSTVLAFSYYGKKCAEFMGGKKLENAYGWFYLLLIIFGAVSSLGVVINIIDIMYAVMAFPTMISTLLLASKVKKEAEHYFKSQKVNAN
jgi:AGCS family alanine or glycine:cation symporter